MENDVLRLPSLPGLEVAPFPISTETVRFDLALWIRQSAEGFIADWQYDRDLFSKATIAANAAEYVLLLKAMMDRPEARLSAVEIAAARSGRTTELTLTANVPKGRVARVGARAVESAS
jgi:non-ribosomal peptide synthetase component F